MDTVTVIAVLLSVMFFVMLTGAPVMTALSTAGVVGILLFIGVARLSHIGVIVYTQGTSYNQIILPMFVMMSEFLSRGQVAEDIFAVLNRSIGRFKGGLAIATTLACAIFAALCGSSPATAASIGRISIQEMTKRGYDPAFAVGTVAASGTLGIMIPPSITLCFFGILTETSIIRLLMAGILPGLIMVVMIVGFNMIRVRLQPQLVNFKPANGGELAAPAEMDAATAKEIISSISQKVDAEKAAQNGGAKMLKAEKGPTFMTILPALVLIFIVLGSMYAGFATSMEAAGYGVIGSFIIVVAQRRLSLKQFTGVLTGTARTGAMMVFLVLCGFILSHCVSYLGISNDISTAITESGLNKYVVLLLLYVLWFVLGCIMDPSSIVILTVPFVFQPLVDLGFDPLWIGIVVVLVSQIGMITPPVGMNLFVLKANTDVSMKDIIVGSIPYVVLLVFALIFFTIFQSIPTIIPNAMFT